MKELQTRPPSSQPDLKIREKGSVRPGKAACSSGRRRWVSVALPQVSQRMRGGGPSGKASSTKWGTQGTYHGIAIHHKADTWPDQTGTYRGFSHPGAHEPNSERGRLARRGGLARPARQLQAATEPSPAAACRAARSSAPSPTKPLCPPRPQPRRPELLCRCRRKGSPYRARSPQL
jgi:hypothetical protein